MEGQGISIFPWKHNNPLDIFKDKGQNVSAFELPRGHNFWKQTWSQSKLSHDLNGTMGKHKAAAIITRCSSLNANSADFHLSFFDTS